MQTIFWIIFTIIIPSSALALQNHGGAEGLYVHQMSHIFFMLSMGSLIYWLRERNLVRDIGWRYIQYSAFLFICWTFDAFVVHFVDEQLTIVRIREAGWQIRINDSVGWLEMIYYIGKLDHLLCVPAIFFLYRGLELLLKQTGENSP